MKNYIITESQFDALLAEEEQKSKIAGKIGAGLDAMFLISESIGAKSLLLKILQLQKKGTKKTEKD